ncbi:hypothetical protein WN51_05153 [Melipona quadrifasciata]|uniref:Uncharacterized protein n=1 Tax=Melipona quadrifasciata TaxID=166423 RepID=A0A0N0BD39_9HYME|nr:hypothetical protein WN51_05153 [Melipona quadrifasciata]
MAPRKTTKHTEAEVERAPEADDVSLPKKKKTVAKAANKIDEEKQVRLPRAAKLTKIEQTEGTETTTTVTKNTKTKIKTSLTKNASVTTKTNSKVKPVPKKNKEAVDKDDIRPVNELIIKSVEKNETKKTRARTTKKAGIDVEEEPKEKTKRRLKKPVNENAENSTAKKRKQKNVEVASKDSKPKPKARAAKKKPAMNNDTKDKVNNKATAVNDNEIENDAKSGDYKFTKVTAPRKTRGRKNESNSDDITNNDETTEKLSSSETVDTNNEKLAQTVKKGRNVKKQEVSQKKPTKTRGKATSNEDVIDTTIVVKEAQKKTNKEALVTLKRVRGKVTENAMEEKKELNSSETLSNNNIQKLLEDDKKEDAENEEIKHIKTSGMSKKIDDVIIKDEINENNVMSTSVDEEEN